MQKTIVLLGHNGAGKSTLIRFLLGFYPDRKAHPFLGCWSFLEPLSLKAVGYVPESPYLDGLLTGREMLKMMSTLKNINNKEGHGWESLIAEVGLKPECLNQRLNEYSKGMKQRLMIAMALLGNPTLLVLDEPLSGLDPFGSKALMRLLQNYRKRCDLFISTHSLVDAYALADEIWLLKEGTFIYKDIKPDSLAALERLYFEHPPACSY